MKDLMASKQGLTGYKVGNDIDSKCLPACGKNLVLAHTIVSMVGQRIVRVQCNTCKKEHAYRPPDSPSEATAARRRAERKKAHEAAARGTPEDFDALANQVDLSRAERYSMKMALEVHSVVDHPRFGLGIVAELKEGNKALLVFNDGPRVLVYGRA